MEEDGSKMDLDEVDMTSTKNIKDFIPEKVLFCVDVSDEMSKTLALKTTGVGMTIGREPVGMDLAKRLIKRFISVKGRWNSDHEFGVITLKNRAEWYINFCNDYELLYAGIDELTPMGSFEIFELDQLLLTIKNYLEQSQASVDANDYVLRVIIIYGRTSVIPKKPTPELLAKLYGDTKISCYIDVIFIHDRPTADNSPQEVYDSLLDLESIDGKSYAFEINRLAKNFALNMAMLLGHPFQRPNQIETSEENFLLQKVVSTPQKRPYNEDECIE
ncbi:uncharacterized protein VTP21DRAFT_9858 [Calcarisporiella thermophila]|uniref:uncharacterized protein n=1 Tax=Calcarisporiella thermophila TaxID=911321 RepID=UPI00374280F9